VIEGQAFPADKVIRMNALGLEGFTSQRMKMIENPDFSTYFGSYFPS